jgi:hypothetical protein
VDISRDWEVTGTDKRAGGLMRSSIHVASILPSIALILIFNLRSRFLRVAIALLTLPVLYWTTQKGSIVAYGLVIALLGMAPRRPILLLRPAFVFVMILQIALPTILPGYHMPHAAGQFSMASFNERVEYMWPRAWHWINHSEAFPLGIGLGGIGGAQILYAPYAWDAADNLYIFMYAWFGAMTFVYLGWVTFQALRTPGRPTKSATQAMAILVFLVGYGSVISILEDQMGSLFFGASAMWLWQENRRRYRINNFKSLQIRRLLQNRTYLQPESSAPTRVSARI